MFLHPLAASTGLDPFVLRAALIIGGTNSTKVHETLFTKRHCHRILSYFRSILLALLLETGLSTVDSLSYSRKEGISALYHGALSCEKQLTRRWVHCGHTNMDMESNNNWYLFVIDPPRSIKVIMRKDVSNSTKKTSTVSLHHFSHNDSIHHRVAQLHTLT